MRARIFEKQKPVGDESSFFRIRASITGGFAFQGFYGVPEERQATRRDASIAGRRFSAGY